MPSPSSPSPPGSAGRRPGARTPAPPPSPPPRPAAPPPAAPSPHPSASIAVSSPPSSASSPTPASSSPPQDPAALSSGPSSPSPSPFHPRTTPPDILKISVRHEVVAPGGRPEGGTGLLPRKLAHSSSHVVRTTTDHTGPHRPSALTHPYTAHPPHTSPQFSIFCGHGPPPTPAGSAACQEGGPPGVGGSAPCHAKRVGSGPCLVPGLAARCGSARRRGSGGGSSGWLEGEGADEPAGRRARHAGSPAGLTKSVSQTTLIQTYVLRK